MIFARLLTVFFFVLFLAPIDGNGQSAIPAKTYPSSSILSSGNWYKIGIPSSGIYKLTYRDLLDMGFSKTEIQSQNISIFGNGGKMLSETNAENLLTDLTENAIYIKDNDGVFQDGDYILFYAQGPHIWEYNSSKGEFNYTVNSYSDLSFYFITCDAEIGTKKRIQAKESFVGPVSASIVESHDYFIHKKELNNLLESGSQWVGEEFSSVRKRFSFPILLPDIVAASTASIDVAFLLKDPLSASAQISMSGNIPLGTLSFPSTPNNDNKFFPYKNLKATIRPSSSFDLFIDSDLSNTGKGWLNYIQVNYRRNLILRQSSLAFRSTERLGNSEIAEFQIETPHTSQATVWDVTNPLEVKEIKTSKFSTKQGVYFSDTLNILHEYIIFAGQTFPSPSFVGKVENQNLHALPQVDYLIISHPSFLEQANALAELHRLHSGLLVAVVSTEQVYNEFSSGRPDYLAFRNAMKMFFDRASKKESDGGIAHYPKYLLFFGKGCFDNKNLLGSGKNLILSYQSDESFNDAVSYSSDDLAALLEDNATKGVYSRMCIGVGRFPVTTTEEANLLVSKTKNYLTKADLKDNIASPEGGSWRNHTVLSCDDADLTSEVYFLQYSESLSYLFKQHQPHISQHKIYSDAYKQTSTTLGTFYPEATKAINDRMNKGCLFFSYIGHGSAQNLSSERLITPTDISNWKNGTAMPLFFASTCSFNSWDGKDQPSSGENVVLNPYGGAIANVSPSRKIVSTDNFNKTFTFHVTHDSADKRLSFGAALAMAKNASLSTGLSSRSFILLGDPALKLPLPTHSIVTTSINGNPTAAGTQDTIRALSSTLIEGEIRDANNNLVNDFNGSLFVTVYDKVKRVYTLGNDHPTIKTAFLQQNSIIYKGKHDVVDGKFAFTFNTPKDIAYHYDLGKINYYAQTTETDAAGYFQNIIVGGIDSSASIAFCKPQVTIYLNDSSFLNGGTTDENPILFAEIFDSLGINTSGSGIGHDITASIDQTNIFILNDYYTPDSVNSQRGSIRYPFKNLSEGVHTLSLQIWNIHNQSTSVSISFEVISHKQPVFRKLKNFPNPFRESTKFVIEHNQLDNISSAEIHIYNMNGLVVKTLRPNISQGSYTVGPISWNGTFDNGNRVPPGIYIYRIILRTKKGEEFSDQQKLILLP